MPCPLGEQSPPGPSDLEGAGHAPSPLPGLAGAHKIPPLRVSCGEAPWEWQGLLTRRPELAPRPFPRMQWCGQEKPREEGAGRRTPTPLAPHWVPCPWCIGRVRWGRPGRTGLRPRLPSSAACGPALRQPSGHASRAACPCGRPSSCVPSRRRRWLTWSPPQPHLVPIHPARLQRSTWPWEPHAVCLQRALRSSRLASPVIDGPPCCRGAGPGAALRAPRWTLPSACE